MGQINLPVLNRTGYSTFWQSVWDEKHNFNRSFKEDYLIRAILPFFFFDRISKKKQFIHFNTIKSSNILKTLDYWSNFTEPNILYQKILFYFKRKKKIPYFILKIWILKFHSWLIVLFSIYSPVKFFSLFTVDKKTYELLRHFGYYHIFLKSLKINTNYITKLKYNKTLF